MEYFEKGEFKCKCDQQEKCNAAPIDFALVMKLNAIRSEYGKPLIVSSGSRCAYWNEKQGGVDDSQHLLGFAVDVKVTPVDRFRVVELAIKHGMTGIGIGSRFIHLDVRKVGRVLFTY